MMTRHGAAGGQWAQVRTIELDRVATVLVEVGKDVIHDLLDLRGRAPSLEFSAHHDRHLAAAQNPYDRHDAAGQRTDRTRGLFIGV